MTPLAKRPRWPEIIWASSPDPYAPRILGLNPWIYDFAAYNLWSRPVGLLACLDMLRKAGARVALLDCLDKTWADINWPRPKSYGQGHYPKVHLPRPSLLAHVPRNYSRYGLPLQAVEQALPRLSPPPDLVLVTSIMTYWYPGVITAIRMIRRTWPHIPIVLGGIYASLCFEHAQCLDVDLVIKGPLENQNNWQSLWRLLDISPPPLPKHAGLTLALDLYPETNFAPILGSRGCPFHCAYCASNKLFSGFRQKEADLVFEETYAQFQRGTRDFAFYDDALLVNPDKWLWPFLELIHKKGLRLRLHTPNAMHIRYLSQDVCHKLKKAGLTTIRLGLESADFQNRLDAKLTEEEWQRGIKNILRAGFKRKDIAAYILFGLPGQKDEEIELAIKKVKEWGIRPELAYYTPIPGSKLFSKAQEHSPYPLDEPLFQNNSIWPCVPGGFSWEKQKKWKEIIKD